MSRQGASKKQLIFRLLWIAVALLTICLSQNAATASLLAPAGNDAAASIDEVQDRELERAASRLYDGALNYYKTEAYWKAARELITILDYYPAYSKIDGVLMHLGESLYNMHMLDSASRMFRYLATKYPNSVYLGEALQGLQRIYYETGDYEESLKIYNTIAGGFAEQEIVDGAHYFGGMAYFQMQNYDSTVAAMARISPRSRHFDFGLYTTGLALLKKKAFPNQSRLFADCSSSRRSNRHELSWSPRRI